MAENSVVALAEATQEISRGRLDYRVDIRAADEIGDLVRSFNQMAEELEGSRRQLESSSRELEEVNVALEQPEEILITWDSGFGNNELGSTEDVLGTDGTIARGQQIRYLPQKVNRPQGTEMLGNTRTG